MKEVKVIFKTITPLITANAWQENKDIRASSLMGSLRFWFEVICYFSGICEEKDFNTQLSRFEKEVDKEKLKDCLKNNRIDFDSKIKCLVKQNIPLPSIIFGTNDWKSLIEIKEIRYISDYCFGNKLDLPFKICISKKEIKIKKDKPCPKKSNNDWSVFYFPHPYFYGKFEVLFEIEKNILESIFFPLLSFMDEYGYWGGKWNLGYGRLKIEEIYIKNNDKIEQNNKFKRINNWKKEKFKDFRNNNYFNWKSLIEIDTLNLSTSFEFIKKILEVDSFDCKNEKEFAKKTNKIPKKFKIIFLENLNEEKYEKIIERLEYLLRIKFDIRNCLRHICEKNFSKCFETKNKNDKKEFIENKEIECNKENKIVKIKCCELNYWKNFRHQLLGERGEGSKILPYINEDNENIKAGFLSIAGLLNLEGGNNA